MDVVVLLPLSILGAIMITMGVRIGMTQERGQTTAFVAALALACFGIYETAQLVHGSHPLADGAIFAAIVFLPFLVGFVIGLGISTASPKPHERC